MAAKKLFTQIFIYFSKPLRLLYSLVIYEIVNFSFFTLYSLLLLSFFLYLKSVPIYVIVHVYMYVSGISFTSRLCLGVVDIEGILVGGTPFDESGSNSLGICSKLLELKLKKASCVITLPQLSLLCHNCP